MKRLLSVLLLLPALAPSSADAAELSRVRPQADEVKVTEVRVESTMDLLAEGWEEVSADVWRRTTADGVEQEIAVGAAAYQRALSWLDEEIEALSGLETLRDSQSLRLLELFHKRDLLVEFAYSVEHTSDASKPVCGGTALFEHTYGWANFAYAYAEAKTRYTRWQNLGVDITTYASARACNGSGSCVVANDDDTSPGVIVSSYAYADYPSWSCTADAYGWAYVPYWSGSCEQLVSHSSSWSC